MSCTESILGSYSDRDPSSVELSREIQDEFINEFKEYKEALEVKVLLARSIAEEEKKHPEVKPKEKLPRPSHQEALATAIYGESSIELWKDTLSLQPGSYQGLLTASETAPELEAALEEKALQEKVL